MCKQSFFASIKVKSFLLPGKRTEHKSLKYKRNVLLCTISESLFWEKPKLNSCKISRMLILSPGWAVLRVWKCSSFPRILMAGLYPAHYITTSLLCCNSLHVSSLQSFPAQQQYLVCCCYSFFSDLVIKLWISGAHTLQTYTHILIGFHNLLSQIYLKAILDNGCWYKMIIGW